ncbi:hypothetical protein HYFRA_00008023 [Hymenoscyphus fraxineus]|uniref:Uncharacterized protein n=1 Tax=Hymenoscyphus fraxineus TaxID=746836 RepID=A0A9N9PG54_9HELO|nr:hypothetical protein HYFRA_00008023 [Hymenoscyphus fraxineus]
MEQMTVLSSDKAADVNKQRNLSDGSMVPWSLDNQKKHTLISDRSSGFRDPHGLHAQGLPLRRRSGSSPFVRYHTMSAFQILMGVE